MTNQLIAMLAANDELTPGDLTKLKYPVWVSYKYDGYRGRILDILRSRTGKKIPNNFACTQLGKYAGSYLDGELTLGQADFNSVQSAFSSQGGCPDFIYKVFDCSEYPDQPFHVRYEITKKRVASFNDPRVEIVEQIVCSNPEEVMQIFEKVISLGEGYDGIIIRDPNAPYKFGRSTLKQGWMLKYKPWKDAECIIEDFEPLYMNTNELETDARGYSVRSHSINGMVEMEAIGAFWGIWNGRRIKVGGGKGVTAALRVQWYKEWPAVKGKKLTFKYLNLTPDGMPRHPTMRGPRLEDV